MQNSDFLDGLANDHTEIKKPESLFAKILKWMIINILCVGSGLAIFGFREDWVNLFTNPLNLLQNILIIFSVISSGFAAFTMARPGQLNKKTIPFILLPFLLWLGLLILKIFISGFNPAMFFKISLMCIKDILIFGMIPSFALIFFIKDGIVLKRGFFGLFATLASFGIGAWASQFTCHSNDPVHILTWHFLPLVVLSYLGVFLATKFKKFLTKI